MIEILVAANKYGVVGLKTLMEDVISHNLDTENVFSMLFLADQHQVRRVTDDLNDSFELNNSFELNDSFELNMESLVLLDVGDTVVKISFLMTLMNEFPCCPYSTK